MPAAVPGSRGGGWSPRNLGRGGVCRRNPSEQTCAPSAGPVFPQVIQIVRACSSGPPLPLRPGWPLTCAAFALGLRVPQTLLRAGFLFNSHLAMELKMQIPSIRSPAPTIPIVHFRSRTQKSFSFSQVAQGILTLAMAVL